MTDTKKKSSIRNSQPLPFWLFTIKVMTVNTMDTYVRKLNYNAHVLDVISTKYIAVIVNMHAESIYEIGSFVFYPDSLNGL